MHSVELAKRYLKSAADLRSIQQTVRSARAMTPSQRNGEVSAVEGLSNRMGKLQPHV